MQFQCSALKMFSSSPFNRKPSAWRPGCKYHRWGADDGTVYKLAFLLESQGEAREGRMLDQWLKRSRGFMVSGLVPYMPDLPLFCWAGKRAKPGPHSTWNVCNNSNHNCNNNGGSRWLQSLCYISGTRLTPLHTPSPCSLPPPLCVGVLIL